MKMTWFSPSGDLPAQDPHHSDFFLGNAWEAPCFHPLAVPLFADVGGLSCPGRVCVCVCFGEFDGCVLFVGLHIKSGLWCCSVCFVL